MQLPPEPLVGVSTPWDGAGSAPDMALDVAGVNTYTEELGSTPRSCRSDMGKMPGARKVFWSRDR